ncbi:MAG TPA: galactokinase family protein, partial [Alphaproteobacteria bacterium]|nr:galactokinase family protein [Alphaproteobacteria bacterium]
MKKINVSAPGSLMLFGEHGVLNEGNALVTAINKRLFVSIKPSKDQKFHILSDQFEPLTFLSFKEIGESLDYTPLILKSFKSQIQEPLEICIQSDFKSTLGFGSSAALCASLLTALSYYTTPSFDLNEHTKKELFEKGLGVIQAHQGYGSGADLAASLYGGVCYFKTSPSFSLEKLPLSLDLLAIYSGFKTPTKEVIAYVKRFERAYPKRVEGLYKAIQEQTQKAKNALIKGDRDALLECIFSSQGSLRKLGVSHPLIEEIIDLLQSLNQRGAKISGSGMGDCVILFQNEPFLKELTGFECYP